MNDVQKAAEARAAKQSKPIGSSFETERQREKRALFKQIEGSNGVNIHKIAATASTPEADESKPLRVAAYCRVSTDDLDQALSIAMQIKVYKEKIKSTPNWTYVGTYVDDGFSGTNTDHRQGFQKLMKDCMDGKIDMIITKAVSRFARNLLDCIKWVEALQNHDPPVRVFFEQENLDTMSQTSGIILFVLAMVAEEESHMKSEAMLLSLEWRFSRGRFITPALLGYDRVEVPDGHGSHKKILQINEDEAQTVRLMYYMLLNGSSITEIASTLTELERETGQRKVNGKPNTRWSEGGVYNVLRNERYCGDVLARKTWTPNFHDHKSKRNNGKKNKYYQPGHHDAIITRAQWNAAQRILNSHRFRHTGGYLPMAVIDHGALTGFISINRSWAGYEADEYYRICSIAMGLTEGELESDLENEHLPDGGKRIAGLTDDNGVQRIARQLSQVEEAVKAQLEGKPAEAQEEKKRMPVEGFQVVSANMFSHALDPVVRFSKNQIAFNSTCISRLNRIAQSGTSLSLNRTQYVELLFNPVERMLAVRPCAKDNPNAICWATENGKSRMVSASAFCRILFSILDWDSEYTYRVPCIVRSRGDETILFFDLDNFIGSAKKSRDENLEEEVAAAEEAIREESEETRGIFFSADDEEEPQEIEDTEEMERKLQELAEIERRTFGTPVFEHKGDVRLPSIDDEGEWDVMAMPKILGDDHRVDEEVVDALQDQLLESMMTNETEGGTE